MQVLIYYPVNAPNIFIAKSAIKIVSKAEFERYYKCIYAFVENSNIDKSNIDEYLEKLYDLLNSSENPLSDRRYQARIKELSTHTSMSTGDIILIDNDYYQVAMYGFTKLSF